MDVGEVAAVVDHGHAGVLLGGGEDGLALLDGGDLVVAPRRELHEVELQAGVLELLGPAVVEGLHLLGVGVAVAGVGAALVPDEAADRERRPGLDHLVPQDARLVLDAELDLAGVLLGLVGGGIEQRAGRELAEAGH